MRSIIKNQSLARFILFAFGTVILLSGCGTEKEMPSDRAIKIVKSAVYTVDSYLDHSIEYDEANDRIDGCINDMSYASDDGYKDDDRYELDSKILIKLLGISADLYSDHHGEGEAYADLLDARNYLADAIGENKRE